MRYTKWDGSLHWHFDMERLGEDEHGVWLGGASGTPVQRGDEPPIISPAFTLLLPQSAHFTAVWNAPEPDSPFGYDVYADMCTPPGWEGDVVTMIDLDLDVVRRPDGTVEIHDEDEFAVHAEHFGYPPEVRLAARRTADDLVRRVSARMAPFDATGERWLTLARAL